MEVLDRNILWSFMFLLAGAVGVTVNYPDPGCAVKGSTVNLPCTFTPIKSVMDNGREVLIEIIRVIWCRNHEICQGLTPSVYDSDLTTNNPRYRYIGDMKGNCTLQIRDVQKEDEGTLRFRMEANIKEASFAGRQPGAKVTVSDQITMKIESYSDREFKKGESVTLNCTLTTKCTFHQLKFTWSRDGHALSESGLALQLTTLAAKDSGNYTCGLKNAGTLSPPYSLYVEAEEEGENGGHGYLYPTVAVVFGVLLLVFALILVFIKRKRAAAADKGQPVMGGEVEQKPPDIIYSNVLLPAEQQLQEPSRAVEEVSYASVQFKHKNQARPAEEAEDAIIYSSVVSRG
ncbi:myeloid cell surface antigen CD33-like [Sebastes fasciatus]|uniref:myeloid cell surface antigen CD33-like n=1 Tax=Sebastes fasciatus TaxID=394691 RepID=UPI003D9EA77E